MKRWLKLFCLFLTGALVASGCWAWYVAHLQMDLAVAHTMTLVREAELGEMMLDYLDNPDGLKARRVAFASSNAVAYLPREIGAVDRQFPWMKLNLRLEPSIERAQAVIRERMLRHQDQERNALRNP